MHYTALIDGEPGAYGVSFPDLPGCVAMGATIDEAVTLASEALSQWVELTGAQGGEIPDPRSPDQLVIDDEVREALAEGAILTRVPLVRSLGRPVKANLSLDSGVLAAIDATASKLGLTRSALVEKIATERLGDYA